MTTCNNSQPLHDPTCGRTVDDHLEAVSDLLPQGRAWPRDPDSTLMRYWRAFAEVIKFAEDRICDLAEEFFCETFTETVEVWTEQYLGFRPPQHANQIDPACLKPGATSADDWNAAVCAKMIEQGGSECGYFTDYALALGWVITCEDVSQTDVVMTGCFHVGCGMLPPKPGVITGGTVGCAELQVAFTGRAADHPYPEAFSKQSQQGLVPCGMIGSNLGVSYLGADCCNAAGYYERPVDSAGSPAVGICSGQGDLPDQSFRPSLGSASLPACDTGIQFGPTYGFAHHWRVTVDVPASLQLQQDRSNIATLWSPAGCMFCGDACGPLRGAGLGALAEALEEVKPAHTVLAVNATRT